MAKEEKNLPTTGIGSLLDTPYFTRFPNIEEFFTTLRDFGRSPLLQRLEESTGLTITEDNDKIYVEASLPGLSRDDIQIDLDNNNILWIRGEKKEEKSDKNLKIHRKAVSSFSYRVQLPGLTSETQEPQAVLKNGVMKITFEKAQKNKSKKIDIKTA